MLTLIERIYKTRRGVPASKDLERVVNLPRRVLDLNAVPDLTPLYKRADAPAGEDFKIWPIQSAALFEAEQMQGGFFPMGVGSGKTLVSLLAGDALQSSSTVLLVPPQLKKQLIQVEIPKFQKYFNFKIPHVISYSELSNAKTADILERLNPDLIVADEAHNLKSKASAKTKRFCRYLKDNPSCRFIALSGTMTQKSLRDFNHLIIYALRDQAPAPCNFIALEDWASAIDVSQYQISPGALIQLCEDKNHEHSNLSSNIRDRYRCRLVSSFGVVATSESSIGTSLIITLANKNSHGSAETDNVPGNVRRALEDLRKSWKIGDEEITDAISFHRVAHQVACGFYYRWAWPGEKVDYEWLDARAAWHSQLRHLLRHSAKPGFDSPLLISRAADLGKFKSKEWEAWKRVKHRDQPPTVAVWIDDFFIKKIIHDATDGGIIWYTHTALGEQIAKVGGLKLFDAGTDQQLLEATDKTIVCSVAVHGTGKNLQRWSSNYFCNVLSGAKFEQTIARTHRPGQTEDVVYCQIPIHTLELRERYKKSIEEARYAQSIYGSPQKLLLCTTLID
jgi:hypothetical protein